MKKELKGKKVFEKYDMEEIERYIEWKKLLKKWEMRGRYKDIIEDEKKGEEERKIWEDEKEMIRKIIDEKWLKKREVVGLWNENEVGDDIRIFKDERRKEEIEKMLKIRKKIKKRDGRKNVEMEDFVENVERGKKDYVGGFVVKEGIGEIDIEESFERENDDY